MNYFMGSTSKEALGAVKNADQRLTEIALKFLITLRATSTAMAMPDALAISAAIAVVIWTLVLAIRCYGALPFYDYWSVVTLDNSWGALLRPHNEHLITLPKIVFGLDTYLLQASGMLGIALIWVQTGIVAILLFLLSPARSLATLAMVIASCFWARHLENLASPFQVTFMGAVCTAVATIFLIKNGGTRRLMAALILAGSAPLWCAIGLATPLIAGSLCLFEKRYRWATAFAVVTAVGLATYLHLRVGDQDATLAKFFASPVHTATVFLNVIVDPLMDLVSPQDVPLNARLTIQTWLLGSAAVVAFIALLWRALRDHDVDALALLSVSLFGFCAAFLMAMGRSNGYIGPAYRYAIFSVCALVPIALLGMRTIPKLASAITLAFCCLILVNQLNWRSFANDRRAAQLSAAMAITADPENFKALSLIHPEPQILKPVIQEMRAQRLSIFR
jgi:hypothetical protein